MAGPTASARSGGRVLPGPDGDRAGRAEILTAIECRRSRRAQGRLREVQPPRVALRRHRRGGGRLRDGWRRARRRASPSAGWCLPPCGAPTVEAALERQRISSDAVARGGRGGTRARRRCARRHLRVGRVPQGDGAGVCERALTSHARESAEASCEESEPVHHAGAATQSDGGLTPASAPVRLPASSQRKLAPASTDRRSRIDRRARTAPRPAVYVADREPGRLGLSRAEAAAAAVSRGRSGRRQDRGRQGAGVGARHGADPAAVLRGHRRQPRASTSGTTRVSCSRSGCSRPPTRSIAAARPKELFSEAFLIKRPLLQALERPGGRRRCC